MRNALPNFAVPQVPELDDSVTQDFLQKHVDQIGQHITRVQQTLARMPDIRSIGHVCEFRLTGATGVPVTSSDVTAITTLYCSPYKGNRIALYDGKTWPVYESVEFSIAVPSTTSTMYDVFCYAKQGVPTLEVLAWTNDTTRATALTTQNGVLVKTGDTSRRYLGSFRTTGSSGQTEDSLAKRYVWNYYNRVRKPLLVQAGGSSWSYTTNTLRQWNGSTANQLDCVLGWSEDSVIAEARTVFSNTSAGVSVAIGIGLDSTTTNHANTIGGDGMSNVGSDKLELTCALEVYPGVGRHTLAALEISAATGTTTWNFFLNSKCGIRGQLWA